MATHHAIAAISQALAGIIREGSPALFSQEQEPSPLELPVELYLPGQFTGPMTEGFSVLLLRVAINGSVRNRSARRDAEGRRFRPSLPLDLHYLITPWALSADRQQRMLGWVMRLIEDLGTLSASHLNQYVGRPDTFAPNESLDIICDPLPLADYLTLWDRLKTLPPSATYTVRMALIDSEQSVAEGEPVRTRAVDLARPVP